jgi:glycosyltransferase involved in cell wall biosynthesis
MTGAPVLATVLVVTYNHARYIADAIDSVLMQKTDFPFEILISEDCSTDGTREIVQQYAASHPNRLTAIYSDRNVRSNEVVARGLRIARGRYIALLDGDDLWTSDSKLQNQAEYLEAHPEASAIFNNALVAENDRFTSRRWTRSDFCPIVTQEVIWQGNPFATCSGMMRSECIRDVPSWYADFFPITDWPLYMLCAKTGNLAFIDQIVGIYRLHAGGLVSALPSQSRLDIIERYYRHMIAVLTPPDAVNARGGCSRYFFDWAKQYLEGGDIPLAKSCFFRCLRGGGVGLTVSKTDVILLGLQLLRAAMLRK